MQEVLIFFHIGIIIIIFLFLFWIAKNIFLYSFIEIEREVNLEEKEFVPLDKQGYLLYNDKRIKLDFTPIYIGKNPYLCYIKLPFLKLNIEPICAKIFFKEKYFFENIGKKVKYINNSKILHGEQRVLRNGDVIKIEDILLKFLIRQEDAKNHIIKIYLNGMEKEEYNVDKEVVRIGRDQDNDIILDFPFISRKHIEINFKDKILLKDLGSKNGTYIAGKLIEPHIFVEINNQNINIGSKESDEVVEIRII